LCDELPLNEKGDAETEAASLVVDQGYSVAEAARAVDVGPSPLRRWVEQLREERDGVTPKSKALTRISHHPLNKNG